jgi:hypothetical protein
MRCKKTFVLAITLLMGLAIPARADFDDGKAAFEQGDYTTALREWKPLAEHGDREAQYWLAQMYARGTGVPQDYREALWWLRKAAKKGHVRANFAIGHMHQYGQGVPPGLAEAAEWYRRAAELGYPEAAYRLANFYAFGQGVWKDDIQAFMWFHIALSTDREMMLAEGWPAGNVQQFFHDTGMALFSLAPKMTVAEISEAQIRAQQIREKQAE